MLTTSTLKHRAHGSTMSAVADYIREQARVAAECADRSDHITARHAVALNVVAEFVASRPVTDERIYALSRVAKFVGDNHIYAPGPQQQRLFGMLGQEGPTPLPETTLDELAAAAADDFHVQAEERIGGMRAELQRAQVESQEIAELKEKVEAAEAQAQSFEAKLEEANGTVASLREQIAHLEQMLGGAGAPPNPTLNGKKPRRVAVEGHTGVYETWNAKGDMRYEIGWREDGKKRWLLMESDIDLQGAEAERAKILKELEAIPA